MKPCYAKTVGGNTCELPYGHDGHHVLSNEHGGWMSWTDEGMAEFARVADEMERKRNT